MGPSSNAGDPAHAPPTPPFRQILFVFGKIGLLSFGGPAAQIALMHRVLVDELRWLDERRFLSALSFCMLLPGPEAMQLATYSGWRLHGVKGGLAAGLLFVAPGALLVLALSMLYGAYGQTPAVAALFVGVKAAVLAIVLQALVRVANRALKGRLDWVVAIAAFVAIFFFDVPFPLVIVAAAAAGYFLRAAEQRCSRRGAAAASVPLTQTLRTLAVWLAMWIVPLFAVAAIFGSDHVLAQLAWFFSKLAVVTFGGAYAVLAYMAQAAVTGYHWLTAGEMLDGLGLAETTNGPLILVTEFVGYIAALRAGGVGHGRARCARHAVGDVRAVLPVDLRRRAVRRAPDARPAARLGAAHRHRRRRRRHRQPVAVVRAARAVRARSTSDTSGRCACSCPTLASLDAVALALSCLALVLVFALRWSIVATLAVCAAAALLWLGLAPV